jgi:flavorubredoxin
MDNGCKTEAVQVSDGIYCVPVNLPGTELFEGMWPMPDGISLNSYVVKGEQTAIIDLIEDMDGQAECYLSELDSLSLRPEDIDYLIINHMEPDHTMWLPEFHARNPHIHIYLSSKAAKLLKSFCDIDTNVHVVNNGDILDLGGGKVLQFFDTPHIHWPETIMTFERESGTLFSCDGFGSYGTREGVYFDDQLSPEQKEFFLDEALRYYANIVASFSTFVTKAIGELSELDIKVVAPSHGVIWRSEPQTIIDAYARFASYLKGPAEPEITLIWSSMYGHTGMIADTIERTVREAGMPVHVHRVPQDHVGEILASAWRSSALILGMPTYEYQMFPPMAWVLDMFRRKKVFNKKILRFGSAGWSGGAQRELDAITEKMKWEFLEPIEWFGAPRQEQFDTANQRTLELIESIRAEA